MPQNANDPARLRRELQHGPAALLQGPAAVRVDPEPQLALAGGVEPTCQVTLLSDQTATATFGKPKARIGKLKVTGPGKLRKGRSATYRAKITNSGNAQATGVRLVVSGRGIRFNAPVGRINAGKTRTVNLRLRPARTGRIKATFKVVSNNAGSKTVRKTITVRN